MSIGGTTANLIGYLGKATQWGREIWAPVEASGAIPVAIQDQHTPAFDALFNQVVGSPTTLDSNAAINAYSIAVTSGHGFTVGDYIVLTDIVAARIFWAVVLATPDATQVDLDRPVNFEFKPTDTVVTEVTTALNVDGSSTRQTFTVGTPANLELDITRILLEITCTAAPDFSDFGDITSGLTRGVVCRVVNGLNTNLFNVKSNGDMALLMHDVGIYAGERAFNVNGISGRLTYGGQSKHGVTIRLAADESLEIIIQDDLTSLLSFRMQASGHLVTD